MPAKKQTTPELDFESSLRRLEKIVEQLEGGDVPLEKSLDLYEEGIGLAKLCADHLIRAEVKLKRLGKDLEGNLKLFEQEESEE
jgi:exodeoxyribonuclease VII small subunit